mmetsp:Transcript_25575/g.33295  ORF Transcript_25575/g.33295 Transcript_25575/m.33295 type:complete len:426 (+) Transcript_25575:98-1375(+)|eukprot:CAMPEP_0114351964 /NCGR_PEP_ID=MMETSP0101-20121206/17592_1 /TAXON_ID=38822 ORGANISM="Pteridomonas danica, Strain PT" /NCGR_SAMPLE_ID=MMETSP0101 /ASSEMBLY_ACC=CAM_ASM_000211 /LENGTH=425 /DNA_ID=CAMNT_0001492131 /DNA_START=22 /DNA_END=1302 /DNA_ORIENTATION=-
MMRRTIPLAAGFFCGTHTLGESEKDEPKLLHATVLFRHGARTPVFIDIPGLEEMDWNICTEKMNNDLPRVEVRDIITGGKRPPFTKSMQNQINFTLTGGGGTCHAGQLSDLGIEQTTQLGKKLRELYGDSLGDDVSKVTVRTTNVPRCVTSARGVMKGLFPNNQEALPMYTMFMKNEYATPRIRTCSRLADLWKAASMSWARSPETDGPRVLTEIQKVLTKEEMRSFNLHEGNFIPLRDMMVALDAHGLKQPYPELVPLLDRIDRLGGLQLGSLLKGGGGWANELETSKLAIGKLLGEVLDRLGEHASHPGPPTLYLVSAHDTTLVPMLSALSLYDGNWPPYASYISFELWEETDERGAPMHTVRVLFNGRRLPLPGCHVDSAGRMPLDDVVKGLAPVIPKDEHKECLTKKKSSMTKKGGDGDKF